jgi:hypothetical protein
MVTFEWFTHTDIHDDQETPHFMFYDSVVGVCSNHVYFRDPICKVEVSIVECTEGLNLQIWLEVDSKRKRLSLTSDSGRWHLCWRHTLPVCCGRRHVVGEASPQVARTKG